MEGQLEREGSGALGEEGVGPDLSGEQLGREMGAGVQGAGVARGSMLTRGPPFCQTGGRHAGPANPPNHRGSGHQPSRGGGTFNSSWGRAGKPERNPCQTGDGSWQDFRPGGKWGP